MSAHDIAAWEYQVEQAPRIERLNELGKDRWELVAIVEDAFYFKRPGLSFREQVTLDQKERYNRAREDASTAGSRP